MPDTPDIRLEPRYGRAPERPTVGPPVPLDAECAAGLALALDTLLHAMTPGMIPTLRETIAKIDAPISDDVIKGPGDDFRVEERAVPGPKGAPEITLLICLPTRAEAPVPVIYHVHGGGMVCGNRRTGLEMVVQPARELCAAFVSVEYRLAPEHPDPAPIEDCYAGLVWIVENASELGIDPARVMLFGSSAGGGLAAGLGLLARDRGGPAVLGQMLLTPMLDDRTDTVSALQNGLPSALQMSDGVAYGTTHDLTSSRTCWGALLGGRCGGPDVSPYASPARAKDLSGLPITFIDVGSAESFRDEAVTYATRIWQAGGNAELHVWPGGFHGYFFYVPGAAISQGTVRTRCDWLYRVLSSPVR